MTKHNIDGSAQERRNSIALAMELRNSIALAMELCLLALTHRYKNYAVLAICGVWIIKSLNVLHVTPAGLC